MPIGLSVGCAWGSGVLVERLGYIDYHFGLRVMLILYRFYEIIKEIKGFAGYYGVTVTLG